MNRLKMMELWLKTLIIEMAKQDASFDASRTGSQPAPEIQPFEIGKNNSPHTVQCRKLKCFFFREVHEELRILLLHQGFAGMRRTLVSIGLKIFIPLEEVKSVLMLPFANS